MQTSMLVDVIPTLSTDMHYMFDFTSLLAVCQLFISFMLLLMKLLLMLLLPTCMLLIVMFFKLYTLLLLRLPLWTLCCCSSGSCFVIIHLLIKLVSSLCCRKWVTLVSVICFILDITVVIVHMRCDGHELSCLKRQRCWKRALRV